MFLPLLKNSLYKSYPKFRYQFTKNVNTLAKTLTAGNNSTLLQQNLGNAFKNINRRPTTTLTIKEYETSRKYVNIWKLERLLGWSLVITIPLAFAVESKEIEMLLGATALTHTYLGCQSMCSDYLRSTVVGKILPIAVRLLIVLITLASLAGTYQLIYEDVGIVTMIKKFWSIGSKDIVPPKQ